MTRVAMWLALACLALRVWSWSGDSLDARVLGDRPSDELTAAVLAIGADPTRIAADDLDAVIARLIQLTAAPSPSRPHAIWALGRFGPRAADAAQGLLSSLGAGSFDAMAIALAATALGRIAPDDPNVRLVLTAIERTADPFTSLFVQAALSR